MNLPEDLVKKISSAVGGSIEKIESDANRDFWLSAEESKKYGLVDKIIVSRTEIQ